MTDLDNKQEQHIEYKENDRQRKSQERMFLPIRNSCEILIGRKRAATYKTFFRKSVMMQWETAKV